MATQKPISTISYNSEPFLKEKLDTWVSERLIQAYQYICHKGEDGDKDHIHVRIEPNKKLDPMALTELLREYPKGETRPLGVRPWRPSKEEDWILYAEHDEEYLSLKYGGGEKGEKIPYDWTDIRVSAFYDMETAHIRAKASMKHSSVSMARALQTGAAKPMDLMLQGENPYLVSTISRLLGSYDYDRLAKENVKLESKVNELLLAIEKAGFTVSTDDQGEMILVPDDTWLPD